EVRGRAPAAVVVGDRPTGDAEHPRPEAALGPIAVPTGPHLVEHLAGEVLRLLGRGGATGHVAVDTRQVPLIELGEAGGVAAFHQDLVSCTVRGFERAVQATE